MRTFYIPLLALLFLFSNLDLNAQDTTFVQTFNFDDITKRRDIFEFPSPSESYSKVLMYKTLKCDQATTQDGYACGEWDYLTYTFLYDHTGELDSTAGTHRRYLGAGSDFDTIYTHTNTMSDVYQWEETYREIDSVISESNYLFNDGSATTSNVLATDNKSGRFQFIIPSSDLTASGLSADTIDRISLNLTQLGSEIDHMTIRMRNYTFSSLDQMEDLNLVTVFHQRIETAATGVQVINLTSDFAWNGTSNILVDISFTKEDEGASTVLQGETQNDTLAIYSNDNDGYVVFEENRNRIEVPLSSYDFGDEITISFWMNGDEDIMPVNTSIFEGVDFSDVRSLNCHLPWSNGSVYWDAGTGSGYDRINKAANAGDFEGNWNHWAMTKNAATGEMHIYLNGTLWKSGTDKNRTLGIMKRLIIGSGMNGNPWYGKMDEFRIWKKELNASEIENWIYKDVTSSHPSYADLALYLKFDDGYGLTNTASTSLEAFWHGAPMVKNYEGQELFRLTTKTNVVPEIHLHQGVYEDTYYTDILDDTVTQPPFSVVEYAVIGNAAEAIQGTYVRGEGYSYVYDQNGNAIDSTFYSGSQQCVNGDLNFFYPPFEVIDRFEIGRFITPYGIGLSLGPDGFTWMYDVTDYAHMLRDSVDLSSGNQQELLDLKFAFIQGTPPANVVELTRPWGQSRSIRYSALDDDSALEPIDITIHPSAKKQKILARFTGHGHNSNSGNFPHCCEWKDNEHSLYVNGNEASSWHIWQATECAFNPVYPQGGTWPGAREGWCPGDVVKDYEYDVSDIVSGSSYELDYRITPVPNNNLGMGNGNYVVAMHVFQYDEPAKTVDAEVYDVIAPSKRGYYSRMNPVCYAPHIVIRNNGSAPMTSCKIKYMVQGGISKTYEWSGYLGFLEKEEVVLPFQDGAFYMGDGSNKFIATVSEPNGAFDGNTMNDAYTSKYDLPDLMEGEVIIQYKTNTNKNDNDLIVYNSKNEVVLQKFGFNLNANTVYWDTLNLDTGCYRLELTDSEHDGLSYWAYPAQGSGYMRIWNDGGIAKTFESEFGNKIEYAFAIDAMTKDTVFTVVDGQDIVVIGGDTLVEIDGGYAPLSVAKTEGSGLMSIYPNPNAGSFYLELLNYSGELDMEVYSIAGQLIHKELLTSNRNFARKFDLRLTTGIYMVHLSGDGYSDTKKIVVER
jgi:hypothetical protein